MLRVYLKIYYSGLLGVIHTVLAVNDCGFGIMFRPLWLE